MEPKECVLWLHGFASAISGPLPSQAQWERMKHALAAATDFPVVPYEVEERAEEPQPEPELPEDTEIPGWAMPEVAA